MAYGWSVNAGVDDEGDEWTSALNQSTLNSDQTSWRITPSIINPNTAAATNILNFAGWAAEDLFNATPEDFEDNVPEDIQTDSDNWTIVSAPD